MIPDSVLQGFFKILLPVGFKVIKHNQPGAAPKNPYCSWQEISNPANGREQIGYLDVAGVYTETIDINKTEAVQVNFYTKTAAQNKNKKVSGFKSANQIAEEMTIRLNTFSSQAYQKSNNIGVMNWTDLTPLVQFMGDKNEQRATVEIFLNNNLNYTEETFEVDVSTIDATLTIEDI
jgi:hypothetical protein